MKKESISETLLRRLDASAGKHSQIAAAAGISQATISRIYLRKVSPTLRNAELLLAWFAADDATAAAKKSALRLPNAKRVRVKRAGAAEPAALAQ